MSFQSREKKRRHKAAAKSAKHNRSSETARRWFLTLARKPGQCATCPVRFGRGAEIVYRHEPREVRCIRCATRLEDSKGYRPSLRWEKARRRQTRLAA
jgi:ribosomal protein S27E